MHHVETRTHQQTAQTTRCERPNRLPARRRPSSHCGLANISDRRNRGDHQLSAGAKDRCECRKCSSLIAVPVKRLRTHHNVDRSGPERQVEGVSPHEVGNAPQPIARLAEHPGRVVDADDLGAGKTFGQPTGELSGPASDIENHLGLHLRQASQHCIVNRPIRRILKTGAVVDHRPAIEQRRSDTCHDPLSHRSGKSAGQTMPRPFGSTAPTVVRAAWATT